MVDYEPLIGAEQLVRDNKRADGIIAGATTGIANHVRIAFCQTRELRWIEARIHAGQDGKPASGWQSEPAFITELFYVALIRRQDIIKSLGHGDASLN